MSEPMTPEQQAAAWHGLAENRSIGLRDRLNAALQALEFYSEQPAPTPAPTHLRRVKAEAWDEGVATALNHAIRNDDGVTLRLEHLDGRPWVNPYQRESDDVHDAPEAEMTLDSVERYEDLLYLDHTSQLILAEWAKHRAAKRPEWDTDYAAHIDHIRQQADRWETTTSAFWVLVGSRLAKKAIEQWEANHASD